MTALVLSIYVFAIVWKPEAFGRFLARIMKAYYTEIRK